MKIDHGNAADVVLRDDVEDYSHGLDSSDSFWDIFENTNELNVFLNLTLKPSDPRAKKLDFTAAKKKEVTGDARRK